MELRQALQEKIDNLNKPKGSLGRLEELAFQIGMIQQTLSPTLSHPVHLLFGADHGIEREGVSVSPRCITWQQMVNFTRGGGGVNMFCRQHGFDLRLIDVGVDYDLSAYPQILNRKITPHGTANFRYGPAMTEEEMESALAVGREQVDAAAAAGCRIISIGEMGIANTSPSSIWMSLLLDLPLERCVGAGAGLNSEGIQHKLRILQESVTLAQKQAALSSLGEPGERLRFLLRYFGGFEMVAAVGAMIHAAEWRMVVLVDGFIMSACALMASRLMPSFMDFAIFCHSGDESGHQLMLDRMGAKPLLHLGLRLGEGTGALCAYPLIDSAVRMLNEMGNFDDNEITKYF
ncbi:MAG: nicotinate-nucleotide--dimethylbenzimidazole phosphoribosyltransferase [Bacteroidaceae bacterium]|nr:nicotinate-nucleotide--dimethylbenzimidazole phosphoribosyltransferase [Bacteroidaceae bacterium]